MPTLPIGIAGPSYNWSSLVPEGSRTVNYFPEVTQSENGRGISRLMLQITPGLLSYADRTADANVGRVRGLLTHSSDILVAVMGQNVYTIAVGGTATLRGTIVDDGNPVSMASNLANQVFINSGGLGYILEMVGFGLTRIIDLDFPNTISIGFLDQYFIALRNTAQQFFASASGNGLSWDALEFATVEAANDIQRAIYVDRRELWFFGQKLTNIYYNSGNFDFPFDVRPGGVIQYGIGASRSVARVNTMLLWLGQNDSGWYQIINAHGYNPVPVSDAPLEETINDRNFTVSDAIGFAQGDFYWLYFPTEGQTWVLDTRTKMWHQRTFTNVLGVEEAHRASCAAYFDGRHLIGDRASGILYELSDATYTDYGNAIRRIRRAPHIMKPARASERAIYKFLRLYCQTGVGILGAVGVAGVNPDFLMRYSDDGARTWSNYLESSMGAIGEYRTVVEWRQLGSTNFERTFEVRTSEPVPHVIMEAYVGVE